MDNITHALAGLLIADTVIATQRALGHEITDTARRTIVIVGVVTAELPDIDLAWSGLGRGGARALDYMLHHRGHSHTLVVAVVAAVVIWCVLLALGRANRAPGVRGALLVTCVLGTLSHILLDWTNSYGVHPFWPFDGRWYYGDAVFIVEPWLWVVAMPAVLLGERTRATRVVLALLLAAILALAWGTDNVAPWMAALLTFGTLAMLVVAARTRAVVRPLLAIGAWIAVEATFFAAGRAAEARVRVAVPNAADVVLTPGAADPLCWSVLVVTGDEPASTYRVQGAVVRPVPTLRREASCRVRRAAGLDLPPSPESAVDGIRWTGEWRAPLAELQALARSDCRAAAALRFMRVPAWDRTGDVVELWDLRYGRGGFASITSDGRGACPTTVPGWRAPRGAMLVGSPVGTGS